MKIKEDSASVLVKYIPLQAIETIINWLKEDDIFLKITKARKTKLGDYRPPYAGKGHRISVNHNLNQYAFLITLIHEIAHCKVWVQYKNKVSPHGNEWKNTYSGLMLQIQAFDVFPKEMWDEISSHFNDPAASSCVDPVLVKWLRKHDEPDDSVFVEDLTIDSIFKLDNGMIFRKGQRLRKRFRCLELRNNKTYLVSPLAKASLVQAPLLNGIQLETETPAR